eukprot:TRINITY_DN2066_c0_g1_i4.p1 TRINITY_DN2066_c0_g1~~TRINITY_DN2066_c0_g1_i4.p1  ORF type:complete len:176 (+),score=28.86 TRINITY_DN2066_c0_g1_i4:52-528(+)
MSVSVILAVCAVLSGTNSTDEDPCNDVIFCPLGKTCKTVEENVTSCVAIILEEGDQCLSKEGELGQCDTGMVCSGNSTIGYCAAAKNPSKGSSLIWLWILLPVVLLSIAGGIYYYSRIKGAQKVTYADFLRTFDELEMQGGTYDSDTAAHYKTPVKHD